MENLGLKWNVTEFTSRELEIKVYFDDPLLISMAESKDTLILSIFKPELFISKSKQMSIKEKELQIKAET